MEKIGKYLREVSVVVIGVAITLFASYRITNKNEKRDMALYLKSIKLELEENIRILDETHQLLIQPGINYSDYLRSHDKKSLNADSLKYYIDKTVFNISSITINTNAFDMFKTSGNMRLVDNKEQLLSIWDSYAKLIELKQGFDMFSQMKLEEMKKFFYLSNNPRDEDILKNPPMYEFHVNMFVPYVQKQMNDKAMASLNETISMFE